MGQGWSPTRTSCVLDTPIRALLDARPRVSTALQCPHPLTQLRASLDPALAIPVNVPSCRRVCNGGMHENNGKAGYALLPSSCPSSTGNHDSSLKGCPAGRGKRNFHHPLLLEPFPLPHHVESANAGSWLDDEQRTHWSTTEGGV